MITKAIILGKQPGDNKYSVRIPLFETSSSPEQYVAKATACISDGVINPYSIGDVVYVGFESNEYDQAVILGKLSLTGLPNAEQRASASYAMDSLSVANGAALPAGTSIGELTYKQLIETLNMVNNGPAGYELATDADIDALFD